MHDHRPERLENARELARAAVRDALGENPDPSIDELNAAVERRVMQYNRRPQPELGGLSPERVRLLTTDPWDGSGPLTLGADLRLDELADSRLLENARVMLGYLAERGEVKATARGNLPRAAVGDLAPRMRWGEGYLDSIHRATRVVNEEDLFPLHVIRILLELGGLAKRRKGVISLTRRGKTLLDDARAGELFALLFRTHFQELNLAYLSRFGPEAPGLQATIGYSLYKLGRSAAAWKRAERLAVEAVLPRVREEIEAEAAGRLDAFWLFEHRILSRLEAFGLLRTREIPRSGVYVPHREYRKSALYDRFLRFSRGG